jgi:RNA polymerase sigma-70 factor (ECF subfamily)
VSSATVQVAVTEARVDQRVLVERAQRGDHDAFAALVDASIDRLDAAARLILRDRDLARDAVQEALIRAWRDLPGLRDPSRYDAWLQRLTVNACLDLLRRRRRRPIEVEITTLNSPAASDTSADIAQREMLDHALGRLTPAQRAVVALHYLLGMPLPEVAASLGIPYGTAKSRLHYSLAAMRVSVLADSADTTGATLRGGQLA